MIDKLTLKNFSAFKDLQIDFSSGINVIIGENGCGKTQLLKAAYSANQLAATEGLKSSDTNKEAGASILAVFSRELAKIGKLAHRGAKDDTQIEATLSDGSILDIGFNSKRTHPATSYSDAPPKIAKGTFIPTKEVLSFVCGIKSEAADEQTIHRLFDATYLDLVEKLTTQPTKETEERAQWGVSAITNSIGGQFVFNDNNFEFQRGEYVPYTQTKEREAHKEYFKDIADDIHSVALTAEGFKKLGILQILLNSNFIGTGTNGPLIWDEPESNLNPQLMECLVNTLLTLSEKGQQIILASHDYVLLKWIDLLSDQKKGHHIRYHSLHRNDDSVISVNSADDYKHLEPNAISKTFNDITKAQVKKNMGDLMS